MLLTLFKVFPELAEQFEKQTWQQSSPYMIPCKVRGAEF
jgi:hypothetical protein